MDRKTKYTLEIEDDNLYDLSEVDDVLKIKEVCGWYNKDEHGNYCKDEKHVKYLRMPPDVNRVNFDLNRTHENDIRKPEAEMKESIDSILRWVSLNCKDQDGKPKLPEADFVCYRGLLYRIMCVPFENKESLKICAIKVKGTTYLCQFFTEQNRQQKMEQKDNKDLAKFTRWGHVFEHYMVAKSPEARPEPSQPMSEYEEFNCVFSSQIGPHNLIYGAEVDGVKRKEDLDNLFQAQLVELKTCRQNPNPFSFSKYKLIKWWAQSALAKIDTIIVGYRDDQGFVKSLQEMKVKDIPRRAKGWSAPQCMVFLKDFLNFAKYVMKDAQSTDVYEFVWYPNEVNYVATKLPDGNDCHFFPDWFDLWLKNFDQ